MKFGVLARNSRINSRIYQMFEDIDPSDVPVFVKKFNRERDEQRLHTFRELTIGSQLRRQGLKLRYGRKIYGKTPDWVIVDDADQVLELLDVTTLHQLRELETDMRSTLSAREVWIGWATIPPDHIYSKMKEKAKAYASLASKIRKPYIVCLFGDFLAGVDPDEVQHVLYQHHGGLFSALPTVSGMLYFLECSRTYEYFYFPNHTAEYPSLFLQCS